MPVPTTCTCFLHDAGHGVVGSSRRGEAPTPSPCRGAATVVVTRRGPRRDATYPSCATCAPGVVANLVATFGDDVPIDVEPLGGAGVDPTTYAPECECFEGEPTAPDLSGHEFSPFDASGEWVRASCPRPAVWRGLWQCGGCPDTHVTQVCEECRRHHDADAATGAGARLMWLEVTP